MSPPSPTLAATGLASGPIASTELARQAVTQALDKLGQPAASSLLLLLSADFAPDPQAAIRAAAQTAGTLQVAGCSATGILTEQDWIIDAPAAAALVLARPWQLTHAPAAGHRPQLCLAAPNAINTGWLQGSAPCFGGVAGDMTGRGQYKVWSDARIRADGKARWHSVGCTPRLLLAHGLQRISPPFTVTASQQLNLHTLDQRPALATLAATGLLDTTPLAQLRLAVLHGDDPDNDTALLPIPLIAVNPDGSVTVARQLQPGERVCWARQSPALSEPALAARLAAYRQRHGPPDFALLFSCASRGPQCWNGQDRDWQQLRHAFPATPLLGMYGNGQFAPAAGANRLLDGALLLALFHGEDDV